MKKIAIFALIWACSVTVFAGNNKFSVTSTTLSDYPHAFAITGNETDTLTIEYLIVDCPGANKTPVHIYMNPQSITRHQQGGVGSIIWSRQELLPNTTCNFGLIFGERLQSEITITVVVKDRLGKQYFICCQGEIT